jgi:hypothetical protein
MSGEVRTLPEGTLRGVQASGSGLTWATASAPASGLFGFVQNGMSITSAQTVTQIMDRGIPVMNKITEKAGIKVTVSQLVSYQTGQATPFTILTASGSTVPMQHLEWKQAASEQGAGSGMYYQFYGVATESLKLTEDSKGNKYDFSFVCLGYTGPTASGFLS